MKMKLTLLAATLAAFAASTVYAAEEAIKTETPKAEAKKPVKKHSHASEKIGTTLPEAASGVSHQDAMKKDMPMHDHTKDKH